MRPEDGLDMSFSGLKTALRLHLERDPHPSEQARADLAASFEQAVADALTKKALRAARETGLYRVAVAGGVSLNTGLRKTLQNEAQAAGVRVIFPPAALCGDNGAMIALAGAERLARGERSSDTLAAHPSLDQMDFFAPI
jgi:N6-L-threonylcarbamoyladenine synthase